MANAAGIIDSTSSEPKEAPKAKRDDWMMIPPSQDDLSARMDPTKIRARKFNTGKGAKASGNSGEIGAVWTETPEQKRQRLQNEIMGVASTTSESSLAASKSKRDEEMARRVKEHTVSAVQLYFSLLCRENLY